jgi:hypothetical protein
LNIYDLLRIVSDKCLDPYDDQGRAEAAKLIDRLESTAAFGTVASEGETHDHIWVNVKVYNEPAYSPYRGYGYKERTYTEVTKCQICGKGKQ